MWFEGNLEFLNSHRLRCVAAGLRCTRKTRIRPAILGTVLRAGLFRFRLAHATLQRMAQRI